MQVTIASPEEMERFAACYARHTGADCKLYLSGALGTGKTTFVRGLLRAHGYGGIVKSPTYTLVESYELPSGRIHHFDLYRITAPAELENIGCRDYFDDHSICLVEWPERGGGYLPVPDLTVNIRLNGARREVYCRAHTGSGEKSLTQISETDLVKTKKNI